MSLDATIARVKARVDNRKDEAEKMRAAMPLFAAQVDDLRRVFGALKVTYAQEGETRRGKPREERSMNADEWLRYVRTGEGWEMVAACAQEQ